MPKKKRPKKNYAKEVKDLVLSMGRKRKHVGEEGTLSVSKLSKTKGAPAKTTIYRWMEEAEKESTGVESSAPKGRPPKLSEEELFVVGGYVLDCNEHHVPVEADKIKLFVAENFHEDVSSSWVSRTMETLHLSSHHSAKKEKRFAKNLTVSNLYDWLVETRETIQKLNDPSRLVVIDTVRFTNVQCILRTYSPEGG